MKKLTAFIFSFLFYTVITAQSFIMWPLCCGIVSGVTGVDIYVPQEVFESKEETKNKDSQISISEEVTDPITTHMITSLANGGSFFNSYPKIPHNKFRANYIFNFFILVYATTRAITITDTRSLDEMVQKVFLTDDLLNAISELEEIVAREKQKLETYPDEYLKKKMLEEIELIKELKKLQVLIPEIYAIHKDEENFVNAIRMALTLVEKSPVSIETKKAFVNRMITTHERPESVSVLCSEFLAKLPKENS